MDSSLFGMLLFALGGLAGAVFALPFRGIRGWKVCLCGVGVGGVSDGVGEGDVSGGV